MSNRNNVGGPSNSPANEVDKIWNVKVTFVSRVLNFMQNEIISSTLTSNQEQNLLGAMDTLRELFDVTESDMEAQVDNNLLSEVIASPEELRLEAVAFAFRNRELGVAALEDLQHGDAAEYFTKSIRAYPNDALVFVNRATAYSRLNRFQDAIADCNTALTMDPNCFEAHHTLGNIYYFLRQLEDSLVEFEEAVRLNPNNAQYRDHLQDARDRYTAYLATRPKRNHDDSDAGSGPPVKRRRMVDPPRRNRQGDVVPGFPRSDTDLHSDLGDDSDTGAGDWG